MKQRHIDTTLKRALPPIAALTLATLLILTALPPAGAIAPCCGVPVNESKANKRIRLGSETAAAHSLTAHPVPPPASPLPPPGAAIIGITDRAEQH